MKREDRLDLHPYGYGNIIWFDGNEEAYKRQLNA